MRLRELVHDLALETRGDSPVILGIEYDSRRVAPGSLFVALRGAETDGHRFIEHALARGAAALLVEEIPENLRARGREGGTPGIARVANSRQALATVAARFFDHPARAMSLVGVTGTNGKTSSVRMLSAILEQTERCVGSLGTIAARFAGREERARLTTPESLDLQRVLRRMRDAGVDTVVLEVSSHSLALDRVFGLCFDAAVFTHLTQDHLDFHGTMERYFEAKARLFASPYLGGTAILGATDPRSAELARRARATGHPVITFGRGPLSKAQVHTSDESVSLAGSLLRVEGTGEPLEVAVPLAGEFQVDNALAAIATAAALEVPARSIVAGLRECPPVPGRLERIGAGDPIVLVDYAHTPDALRRVLESVRPLVSGRVICLFGCGGDRDRTKRAEMARAACAGSDRVIATSDNPRSEDPGAILRDVEKGLSGPYEVIEDRRQAIRRAIESAEPGDAVLLAGKGHEDIQLVGGRRLPFDDRLEARTVMREIGIPL
ncbi:MAG: UDP-N-acetylmuramoyl-L-alanyl-D-glutamate--2,6-diaminopimelate ligase [Myxococcota bacterium]